MVFSVTDLVLIAGAELFCFYIIWCLSRDINNS